MHSPLNDPNSAVMSVITRCLLEPAYCDLVEREDPALPKRLRAALAGLDFDRLHAFGGFISKVQHNYLWEDLPKTRTMLQLYGLELDAFAKYRYVFPPIVKGPRDRQEKLARVCAFLSDYLSQLDLKSYPGLADMFRHEQIESELRVVQYPHPVIVSDLCSTHEIAFDRICLRLSDDARVARFTFDPVEVATNVEHGIRLPLHKRPCFRCYFADRSSGELKILDVPRSIWSVLSRLDGTRSIRRVLARFSHSEQRQLRHLIRQLWQSGIVYLPQQSAK